MQLSLSDWSPSDWETFFNVIYFGLAFFLSAYVLVLYRAHRPKYYGPLYWAVFLILCASLLFGLYNGSLNAFLSTQGLKPDEEAVRTRLTENLRVLIFVVPVVMLAIAANLITQFLNAPSRSERNSDKSPDR